MDGIGSGAPLLTQPQVQNLLRIEFARARRYSYPLSSMLLEVDGLDRLRGERGAAARDQVLEQVIRRIQGQLRASDTVGLIHDRVAFILPHTDVAGARSVAERILESVRKEPVRVAGDELRTTVSIGISAFAERSTIFYDSIQKTAEVALVQALARGGNRVEVAELVPGGTPA